MRQIDILQMLVLTQYACAHDGTLRADLIPLEEEFLNSSLAADEGIAQHAEDLRIDAEVVEVESRDGLVEILQPGEVPRDEGTDSLVLDPLFALCVGVVRERQSDLKNKS